MIPGRGVLFIAEAVTLAHVGRAVTLASILHHDGIEVTLACDARYRRFVDGLPFPVTYIRSISSETFLKALARGRPVFSERTLAGYVEDDLALLNAVDPQVVVGDFRLSLSVSARVTGIAYVNVTNAYWSPHARPCFRMPSLGVGRRLGPVVRDAVFRVARPLAFAMHAIPMNRVRAAYGLPSLGRDVRNVYCDGDLTLYADVPELIPVYHAPSNHRYIGPVLWSPPGDPPVWWNDALAGASPIYISLGSSGPANLLPMLIEALRPLGLPIVAATAGRGEPPAHGANVWTAAFVPGSLIAAKACVVICNGGSPTTQQALSNGVPVIGIASNLDQYLNMDYIERFGAGVLLRGDRLRPSEVRDATARAIDDPRLRGRASIVKALAVAIKADAAFPAAIRGLTSGTRSGATDLSRSDSQL